MGQEIKDFLWGAATSSYQIEGAVREDGRVPSIWDTFCAVPGNTFEGHDGSAACDHYHRYEEDIGLMKDLNVGAYRFSIAWPRIQTQPDSKLNRKGADFYDRLIDSLLEKNIEPMPTLYHWDLPQSIQDTGGWTNRDTARRFAEYADICFGLYGDRVKRFITINEPYCVSILGHLQGVHAPGIKDRQAAYSTIHHLHLAHGYAVTAYRDGGYGGEIGIALNLKTTRPVNYREENILAADRAMDRDCRMFIDPLFSRPYPQRHLDAYPDVCMPIQENDYKIIAQPIDFLGLNYYNERLAAWDAEAPEQFKFLSSNWLPQTDMGWEICPEGLYRQVKWISDNYPKIDMYITENGCACNDVLSEEGTVCKDSGRINYLSRHIHTCMKLRQEDIPLKGFFVWSLLDNFEWNYGYNKRFGIVYCDYVTNRRIPKSSYYYLRDIIAGHIF